MAIALGIVSVLAVGLLLLVTHRIAYVRGFRKADRICYERYYKPMFDRDARVMREMTAILRAGDTTQKNAHLYYENRRLKKKAIILAYRYGRAVRLLEKEKRRAYEPFKMVAGFMEAFRWMVGSV